MKKLLILGGSRYILPVIKAAHELGAYVITCDYLPGNIAHSYSDEYCNISIIDKDAVLEMAREKRVDGVVSFACDPGVVTAAYVAEKMGLPSCGPYESVCILQSKGRFRNFLKENGFNVPEFQSYSSVENALSDVEKYRWPVIVKPVDSAGSKGVTRVDKPEDLRKSIEYAIQFSHCNEFIIEEYLEKIGHSSDSDCFSVDGELKFVSFSSQRFDSCCANPFTPSAYTWPASISSEHQKELTAEINRLMKLLGMKTSIYNIETRECYDGKAYIMECSPRGGGNRLAEMLRYSTGVDMIKASVLAALGDAVTIEQSPYDGYWAEVILHSDRPGEFKDINILDNMKGRIIEIDLWVKPGDIIGGFSGANEAIGTAILRYESQSQMEEEIDNITELIKVNVRETKKCGRNTTKTEINSSGGGTF